MRLMRFAFWDRVLPASGAAFVILWVIGAILQGVALPDYRASPAEVVRSFTAYHDLLHVAAFLKGVGLFFFLVFVGALCGMLGRSHPEPEWLLTLGAGSGLASGALLLAQEAVLRAGFHGAAVHGTDAGASAEVASALFDVFMHFNAATAFTLGAFLGAVALVGLMGRALPRWLSQVGAFLSLLCLLGGGGALFWYAAFALFLLWVLAVSGVALMRRQP